MTNFYEDRVLDQIEKRIKKTRKARTVGNLRVETISAPSEQQFQEMIKQYLDLVLIKGQSWYTAHESSIGLGYYQPSSHDTSTTVACKNYYNRFVMAAQRKFQAKGVKAGSHDMYIFYRHIETGIPSCLMVEFKVKYNKAQDNQKEVHAELLEIGFPTIIPKKKEHVTDALKLYGVPNREAVL